MERADVNDSRRMTLALPAWVEGPWRVSTRGVTLIRQPQISGRRLPVLGDEKRLDRAVAQASLLDADLRPEMERCGE
jgi:hypothetical protein